MIDGIHGDYDPERDLVLRRIIPVPPALVWAGWTKPEHLKKWFAPAPWTVSEVKLDLRPGGGCRIVMRSPEGQDFPNSGCYLEIVENERLVFTDALGAGFRPTETPFFTAAITMRPEGAGTEYTARVIHKDRAGRDLHEQRGFHTGWGQCLDQLVALMQPK